MEGPGGEEVQSRLLGENLYERVLLRLLDKTVFLWKNETVAEFIHAAMKVFFRGCVEFPVSAPNLISIARRHLDPFGKVIFLFQTHLWMQGTHYLLEQLRRSIRKDIFFQKSINVPANFIECS